VGNKESQSRRLEVLTSSNSDTLLPSLDSFHLRSKFHQSMFKIQFKNIQISISNNPFSFPMSTSKPTQWAPSTRMTTLTRQSGIESIKNRGNRESEQSTMGGVQARNNPRESPYTRPCSQFGSTSSPVTTGDLNRLKGSEDRRV